MPSPLDQPESSTPTRTLVPDDESPKEAKSAQQLAIEYDQSKTIQPAEEGGGDGVEEEIHTLEVGGQVVKLDKLGPMIINSDGVGVFKSTRRVVAYGVDFVENTELARFTSDRAGEDG